MAGEGAGAKTPPGGEEGPDKELRPTESDARMAEILSGDREDLRAARRELRDTRADEGQAEESADLLDRLSALDFVDSLVGQPGSELPERLGEYRITDLLGRGGMGTVFEAFQESLERPVALKVLAPSLTTDSKMRRRFRAEARANATLHHQHIVPVYGFGETAGYLYFTMERVDGISLDKHISARRVTGSQPDPRGLARQFAGVADALDHAHRRGILHRDVKPGNILVHADGSFALADFGLSKMLNEASMSMSAQGGFLGTLYYSPPEQARGVTGGPASDLYSLGVTMFEALTGELPLRGKTTEAMLDAVLRGEPKRLRTLLPKAPKDYDAVLQKLLHKDPEDRYADGEALSRDLLRIADDEPVKIRRHPMLLRAWRQIRKHPALSSMVALAALLLLVVLLQWRTNLRTRETAQRARYDGQVLAAERAVKTEPGDPAGPPGMLRALTGFELPRARGSRMFAALEAAAALAPEDDEPRRMRLAYLQDPAPAATADLVEGYGRRALARLSERIEALEAEMGLAQRDAVVQLELYRLYVARAVAALTGSVGDRAEAAKDLLRANIQRRGALFPRLLTAMLEWEPAAGADALVAAFEAEIDTAAAPSEDAPRVAGSLLVALSGIAAPDSANLMSFDLDFGLRRRLHERGVEMCGGALPSLPDDTQPGLAARLRSAAAGAMKLLSGSARRVEESRELIRSEVDADGPLQMWGDVYDLIDRSFDPGSGARSAFQKARAVEAFLALDPDPVVVEQLWKQCEAWVATLPNDSVVVLRLRARMRQVAQADGLDAAQAWVLADPEDPDAYLCRMSCCLGDGRAVDDVSWNAVLACQKAFDRARMKGRVLRALRNAESVRPELTALREQIEALAVASED